MWSNDRFSIIRTTMWSTFETRLRSAASSGTVVTPGTDRPYPRLIGANPGRTPRLSRSSRLGSCDGSAGRRRATTGYDRWSNRRSRSRSGLREARDLLPNRPVATKSAPWRLRRRLEPSPIVATRRPWRRCLMGGLSRRAGRQSSYSRGRCAAAKRPRSRVRYPCRAGPDGAPAPCASAAQA